MKSHVTPSTITRALACCGVAPRHIACCDTTVTFLSALASFLRREGAPLAAPALLRRAAARAFGALPDEGRAFAARLQAWTAAVPPSALTSFHSEAVAQWVTGRYPRRTYPVVFLGATNGAAIHLAAAVDAPWLPQTSLVLVRASSLNPEDSQGAIALGAKLARPLLAAAPNVQLHQVVESHPRARFRPETLELHLKRLTLGRTYERFVLRHLQPGGTLVVVDCHSARPCLHAGERHFIQLADPSRALTSTPEPPSATDARWGYAPELTSDALRFADRHGYRLLRLSFPDPERLSPWVAELYRHRVVGDSPRPPRLVVESGRVDPTHVLRTGAVPFWVSSVSAASADSLERYLDEVAGDVRAFDEIVPVGPRCGAEPCGAEPCGEEPRTGELIDRWQGLLRRTSRALDERGGPLFPPHDAGWSRIPDAPRPPHHPLRWTDIHAYGDRDDLGPVRVELLQD